MERRVGARLEGDSRPAAGTEIPGKFEALNRVTEPIIGAAISVHRALGPGLLESTYETCLAYELSRRGMRDERQRALPVAYGGVSLECGYRIDFLVDDRVILEVKAVDALAPIHMVQLNTYLKLSGIKVGLLINFNVPLLRDGIRRILNGF